MGIIKTAPQAHLFMAIMSGDTSLIQQITRRITDQFGPILASGPVFDVADFTDYYTNEMGSALRKQFIVFARFISQENLHQTKIWTNHLEEENSDPQTKKRRVNIDPGYLAPSKLVLFSTKNFSHRIYIGDGIFGEVTLIYMHGKFKPLSWTYADYYSQENLEFLLKTRREIVAQARSKK